MVPVRAGPGDEVLDEARTEAPARVVRVHRDLLEVGLAVDDVVHQVAGHGAGILDHPQPAALQRALQDDRRGRGVVGDRVHPEVAERRSRRDLHGTQELQLLPQRRPDRRPVHPREVTTPRVNENETDTSRQRGATGARSGRMPGVTDDTTTTRDDAPKDQGLLRAIGPKLLVFFIIGDILGTTIYALTGTVSERVGGALWLPFLLAFVVAFMTAFSYLELVGKYPRAAGAALYTQLAFRRAFITFLVAFTVMCSGITSAASAAQAFGGRNLETIVGELPSWVTPLVVVAFLLMLAVINFRGVGESVKVNVVLTTIELLGLLIVIVLGVYAVLNGMGDTSRLTEFAASARRTRSSPSPPSCSRSPRPPHWRSSRWSASRTR